MGAARSYCSIYDPIIARLHHTKLAQFNIIDKQSIKCSIYYGLRSYGFGGARAVAKSKAPKFNVVVNPILIITSLNSLSPQCRQAPEFAAYHMYHTYVYNIIYIHIYIIRVRNSVRTTHETELSRQCFMTLCYLCSSSMQRFGA